LDLWPSKVQDIKEIDDLFTCYWRKAL
jgi:hypothetical protein